MVDGMLGVQGRLVRSPRDSWSAFLQEAVVKLGDGKRSNLCRKMGFQPRALNAWLRGEDCASLGMLARLCGALGCTIEQVFVGALPPVVAVERQRPGRVAVRHPVHLRDSARALLLAATQVDDPPALRQVASEILVSRSFLSYWNGDLTEQLAKERRKRRFIERIRRRRAARRFIASKVSELIAVGIMPGRKVMEKLAREAGYSLLDDRLLEHFHALLRRRGIAA